MNGNRSALSAGRRARGVAFAAAVVLSGSLGLAACVGDQAPYPTPNPEDGTPPVSTPSPGETTVMPPLEYPEPGAAGEAAFYRMPGSELGDSAEVIAGPGTLLAAKPFRIEGECEGTTAPFEVVSTNTGDDAGTVLVEGSILCDDPDALQSTSHSLQYDSGVVIQITNSDNVERAWLRVIQE